MNAFRRTKRYSLKRFLYFLAAKSTKNSGGPRRRHSAYGLAAAPPCSPHTSRVRKAHYPPIRAALLSHLPQTVCGGVIAETFTASPLCHATKFVVIIPKNRICGSFFVFGSGKNWVYPEIQSHRPDAIHKNFMNFFDKNTENVLLLPKKDYD